MADPSKLPAAVLEYWRRKGVKPGFSYADVWAEEHEFSFTAAKLLREDVLLAVRESLDTAIADGIPLAQWKRDLRPTLERMGFWAPQDVTDPHSGRAVTIDPPSRLDLIYDTNLRQARAHGQWERIQLTKDTRPYLLYQVGNAEEHREDHLSWHGLILPVDDPFWQTHMPQNGYRCHCHVRQISEEQKAKLIKDGIPSPDVERVLDDEGNPTGHVVRKRVKPTLVAPPEDLIPWTNTRTGETGVAPRGVHPSFAYTPGDARRRALGLT